MKKVLIDYHGGTHGHFLEFVLNALDCADNTLLNSDPFALSDRGTCRRRIYKPWSLRFCADHFEQRYKIDQRKTDIDAATDCVYIKLNSDFSDTILMLKVAFFRGDAVADLSDVENLHINFFNKCNNTDIGNYCIKLIRDTQGIDLTATSPNLEYYQLRHFLTNSLFNRKNTRYNQEPYYKNKNITSVKFLDFYTWDSFLHTIKMLSYKFDLALDSDRVTRLQNLHREFLARNPWANDQGYQVCKQILDNSDSTNAMPSIGLIEQSWLCASLVDFNGKFYYPSNKFFETPFSLKKYITDLKLNTK